MSTYRTYDFDDYAFEQTAKALEKINPVHHHSVEWIQSVIRAEQPEHHLGVGGWVISIWPHFDGVEGHMKCTASLQTYSVLQYLKNTIGEW